MPRHLGYMACVLCVCMCACVCVGAVYVFGVRMYVQYVVAEGLSSLLLASLLQTTCPGPRSLNTREVVGACMYACILPFQPQ